MTGAAAGNIADLVTAAARRGPGHPALIGTVADLGADSAPTVRTWAELDTAVNAQAKALASAGVQSGDRVVIRQQVGIGYCVAVFGVLRVGAIAIPLGTDTPAAAVSGVLADSGAAVLIGDDVVDTEVTVLPPIEDAPADTPEFAPVGGDTDIALLCYTSGTSGAARGVMLSHRAMLSNAEQCAALRPAPVTAGDRVLLALPLSHAYGLGPGLFQVAAAGATGVLLPRFSADRALTEIERHRVTTLVGVPPMYSALLSVPDERLHAALSTVRLFTSGAAPLSANILAGMQRITGLPVYEGYGLTETGPVLTWTLVSGVAKPGSVGRPLPGVELRIVDSDGDPLPGPSAAGEDDLPSDETGGTGVVAARGPNLFSGYWPGGDHGPGEDGWFRTGDIGYLDADGDLHLVDRANDLIIVNGFNVYPHEVESVLAELDGVAEAAAVGMPDERTGETVKAVMVIDNTRELTTEAVVAHCAERLARFKVPTSVEFVESLPHTAAGKLARALLRKAAR
jgi:long-chain acyl-CoA synthetase